jgi:hypothetical protein
MRNISFAMTQAQIRAGTKTVTRRLGWERLQPGTILCAVEKGQGLKKGEKVKPIREIRVLNVRREPLMHMYTLGYGKDECSKEGYPGRDPLDFVVWFCKEHRPCQPDWLITRIEFAYV